MKLDPNMSIHYSRITYFSKRIESEQSKEETCDYEQFSLWCLKGKTDNILDRVIDKRAKPKENTRYIEYRPA